MLDSRIMLPAPLRPEANRLRVGQGRLQLSLGGGIPYCPPASVLDVHVGYSLSYPHGLALFRHETQIGLWTNLHWGCHHHSVPSMSYLITFAVVFAAFGVAVWIRGRRKGDRLGDPFALLGIPGVYIAGLASWVDRDGYTCPA